MHDLQQWSDNEVSINKQQQLQPQSTEVEKASKQTPGARRKRNIEINIDKLNNRYTGIQTSTDKTLAND